MKKFEYCFITGVSSETFWKLYYPNGHTRELKGENLSNIINVLGQQGWEMAGCGSTGGQVVRHNLYFKREIS